MNPDWPIYWLDEIDSTNEEARRRATQIGFTAQWIAARRQSAGRGRLGRNWVSPEGNLYTTALFRWTGALRDMTRIPFAAALAVADTVGELAPTSDPKLKWPNDVRCKGRKVSGILVESGEAHETRWIAVGMGINVVSAPVGVGQETVSIAHLRGDTAVDASMVLEGLRAAFSKRLKDTQTSFESTRKNWLARAEGLGSRIRVNVNGEYKEGLFKDMGPDGALLLQLHNGDIQTIRAGDVELIKEASR